MADLKRRTAGGVIRVSLWYIALGLVAVLMVYPLVFSILGGFNVKEEFQQMGEILPIPESPTFQNYRYVFSAAIVQPLLHSFTRSLWYTFVVCAMSILMGYVLSRYEFKLKKAVMTFIIVAQVVPGVLTLIPTLVMVARLPLLGGNNIWGVGGHGLYNNRAILYLPLGWGYLIWTFLFTQSMKSFPEAFEEAAEIDGCGFIKTLTKVVLPMQKPIITVIAVNVALGTWNDWMTPFLYINRTQDSTLTAYLAVLTSALQQFGGKDYPKIFAIAVIAIIPPFIIFLYFQKYIIQGIASAGLKG